MNIFFVIGLFIRIALFLFSIPAFYHWYMEYEDSITEPGLKVFYFAIPLILLLLAIFWNKMWRMFLKPWSGKELRPPTTSDQR